MFAGSLLESEYWDDRCGASTESAMEIAAFSDEGVDGAAGLKDREEEESSMVGSREETSASVRQHS